MKKLLCIFIGLIGFYHSVAQTNETSAEKPVQYYKVKDVPNVQLLDSLQYTTDPDAIIPKTKLDSLNTICVLLRKQTESQMAIVVLPAIDLNEYNDAREFANKLFNTWKLGEKGKDNGILLLLLTSKDQREITFEVGYGLEEYLPDGLCKLIQTKLMIPKMKGGDYGGGLIAGASEIQRILMGKSEMANDYTKKQKEQEEENKDAMNFLLYSSLIGGFFMWLFAWRPIGKVLKNKQLDAYQRYINLKSKNASLGCLYLFFISPLLPIAILLLFYIRSLKKKELRKIACEKCGKNDLTFNMCDNTTKEPYCTFYCTNCGYIHKEKLDSETALSLGYVYAERTRSYSSDDSDDSYSSSRSYSSSSSYGSSSSYSSSSSSSGGSYGGGSSGGGGSSTKF